MRTKYLDRGVEGDIAFMVMEALNGTGYTAEEIIPGLVRTIGQLAKLSFAPEECLDEAANLLADL